MDTDQLIGEVQRLLLRPGEILVVKVTDPRVRRDSVEMLVDRLRQVIGGDHKILVLAPGFDLEVLQPTDEQVLDAVLGPRDPSLGDQTLGERA
jgi:hypothetical protein